MTGRLKQVLESILLGSARPNVKWPKPGPLRVGKPALPGLAGKATNISTPKTVEDIRKTWALASKGK